MLKVEHCAQEDLHDHDVSVDVDEDEDPDEDLGFQKRLEFTYSEVSVNRRGVARRRALVRLPEDVLFGLAGVHNDYGELMVTAVIADPVTASIKLVVQGDSLDEVAEGCEPPYISTKWHRHTLADENGVRYVRYEGDASPHER
jgi:hypothetical protein